MGCESSRNCSTPPPREHTPEKVYSPMKQHIIPESSPEKPTGWPAEQSVPPQGSGGMAGEERG
jgi:hypothetical protein